MCYYNNVIKREKKKNKKKFSKPLDNKDRLCYYNSVKRTERKSGGQQHRKKIKKILKNPLTNRNKGAIIKAQTNKEVIS